MASSYIQVVTQGIFPLVHEIMDTNAATTSSSTDTVLTSMTYTPPAGAYLIIFNSDFNSATAGAAITLSYYLGGVQVAVSQRKIIPFSGGTLTSGSARAIGCLQDVFSVNGSQVVDVRWSISSGTATAANRSIIFMQVTAI